MAERSKFSGQLGFVLAAAGSAVGLGNIWRFPYLAAKYGGGIFLLVYLILVVTFGFTVMIAEVAIGRKTGLSPVDAFRKLHKRFAFIGVLGSFSAFIILSYYNVIGGWVLKYLVSFMTGAHTATAQEGFFDAYIGGAFEPIIWQTIFVVATLAVILGGVKKGIERVSKVLMPVLVLLSIAIAIYSCTLPGAMEGVKYYLLPNFQDFSATTVLAAMGQMFYSMSLAMGIMITYGSYLRKEDDLEKAVGQIEIFDTGVAFLAGLMIIPAVFAAGGRETAVNAGPSLMFVTLPGVFEKMGGGGIMSAIVGSAFFLLVLLAALTSAISLMEAVVATICDRFAIKRRTAAIGIAVAVFLLGIPSSLGFGPLSFIKVLGLSILDLFDFITNAVLMPITALLTCLFVGWVIKPKTIVEEVKLSSRFRREKLFCIVVKYIAPIFIVLILISSVLDMLGIAKI